MTARLDACLDCGAGFPAATAREFCSKACRKRWNNRRATRGAELYDLYMAHRFDRQAAQALGVFQAINRMASNWRQEDRDARGARRSWRLPRAVMEERPFLKAIVRHERFGRGAR